MKTEPIDAQEKLDRIKNAKDGMEELLDSLSGSSEIFEKFRMGAPNQNGNLVTWQIAAEPHNDATGTTSTATVFYDPATNSYNGFAPKRFDDCNLEEMKSIVANRYS